MATAADVKQALDAAIKPGKKDVLQRFFKTGPGDYGEGDVFMGVMVPEQREIAKQYKTLPESEVQKLLESDVHEHRLSGLLILVYAYGAADEKKKKEIYDFYVKNTKRINNWDLVDVTAPNIVGEYLVNHKAERKILYALAKSKSLWEERIAIVSTFALIRQHEFVDTLALAEIYLDNKHDLMHKATGWMLREVGKRDESVLCAFLDKHKNDMPRTMLRYAIERLSESKKRKYMAK